MKTTIPIDHCKVLWVIGAAERLATLGMINRDIPLHLTPEAVDDFIEIDNYRDDLFSNDFEVVQIFKLLAESQNTEETSAEDTDCVARLILDYKNNRTELVKYALSNASYDD